MTEELNLSELFSNFVNFVARNSRILIMIVLITVIGVVAFQKLKPTVYETKAICMSGVAEYERQEQIEDLSQRTAIDLVNFLKINIDNEDYQQLSALLGVDIEIANTVKGIDAEQLYQQDMDEKFYALNKFEVALMLYDNSSIENVQNGLLHYFNNNKYIMTYHKEYQRSSSDLLDNIDENSKIVFKSVNEEYIVHVFTDVDCPYCAKLHNNMAEMNALGITVKYLASGVPDRVFFATNKSSLTTRYFSCSPLISIIFFKTSGYSFAILNFSEGSKFKL